MTKSGYLHPIYAQSLKEFGQPYELSSCEGWVLIRSIPNSPFRDAMGCYPLFTCPKWKHLHRDLESLKNKLVSLSLVTDPFGQYDIDYLRYCFPEVVIAFKDHCIVDLNRPLESFVSKHHQRYALQALQKVSITQIQQPLRYLDAWKELYSHLIQRHQLKGLSKFSDKSFLIQFQTPGFTIFLATYESKIVSMLTWYTVNDIAYYHLGASSPLGYRLKTSFALFWEALNFFKTKGLKWLDLGAGAGSTTGEGSDDGLTRFKKGWATGTRTTYFCGRIFDHVKYNDIINTQKTGTTDYFPAYREGEFR